MNEWLNQDVTLVIANFRIWSSSCLSLGQHAQNKNMTNKYVRKYTYKQLHIPAFLRET